MYRPIPIYIIPSHVYLSEKDQETLFGIGRPMTIASNHVLQGQYIYEEKVKVRAKLKRQLNLRVLGPNWDNSFAIVTPTEAAYLGVKAPMTKIGDLSEAAPCTFSGPDGSVELANGVIIARPHLNCSAQEADQFGLKNGEVIDMLVDDAPGKQLKDVLVRVHPTFKLSVEIHSDIARDLWIPRGAHAKLQ